MKTTYRLEEHSAGWSVWQKQPGGLAHWSAFGPLGARSGACDTVRDATRAAQVACAGLREDQRPWWLRLVARFVPFL